MKNKSTIIILLSLFLACTAAYAEENALQNTNMNPNNSTGIILNTNPFAPLTLNDNEILLKEAEINISVIDPAYTSSYYPGGRGNNQLVIYTPNYGAHTGTNEFGTEAIVENNIVTAISGADSTIPVNGLVISGHGYAKNWITQNITVGSKVFVDIFNNKLVVYTTSDSFKYEAQNKIDEALSIIKYYKGSIVNYNYKTPENHVQTAQNYLKLADKEKQHINVMKQYTSEAIDEANMAIKTSLPYMKNELKGVWVRPTEKSPEQIISTLEKIKENGFNNVFLETYFHGKTIFPSKTMNKYGFIVQNELFENTDPLKTWITEAHKKGIKVHIWFQSFYVGNEAPEYNPSSILAQRPDWGNKTKRYATNVNPTKSTSEHNGYFLDPANPQVQEFLHELITEIITEYKPDGINLDYIRYPNSNSRSDINAWGFTEYARNEFSTMFGIDPLELTISDAQWYDWNQYRRDKVTNFVRSIGELGRANHTYISAVIFPDIASALATKQQDWRSWSYNNFIDGFTPLFLTYDSKMLASMMNDVIRVKSPRTDLYAGLFVTFMGGASEDLIRQIFETRKMNANGVILFDYAHTTPVYTSTLMASAFNANDKKNELLASQKKKKIFSQKENKKSTVRINNNNTNRKTTVTTTNKGTWIFSK